MARDLLFEPSLPRRSGEQEAHCINPHCDQIVRVRGEFCRTCVATQQRTREELRRSQERAS